VLYGFNTCCRIRIVCCFLRQLALPDCRVGCDQQQHQLSVRRLALVISGAPRICRLVYIPPNDSGQGALDARGTKLMPDKKDRLTFRWSRSWWHLPNFLLNRLLPGYVLDAEHDWLGHLLLALEAFGHLARQRPLSSMSPAYLMGWLRDYLWLYSAQLINGYNPTA